jgi:hypothetical protein
VRYVCQSARPDNVFIQLEDTRNIFTDDLMTKIRNVVATLTLRTYYILKRRDYDDQDILAELSRLFVR